jgi:hypothetical protein
MTKQPITSLARHCLEAVIAKNRLQIAMISMVIAFSPLGNCAWGSRPESQEFSGRIQAGAGYVTSTDQLKKDADKRLDGLSTNADRFDRGIPLVLLDLRYTFASGRQLYLGTPIESGGRPGLSLGAVVPVKDAGKLDMSVFAKPFEKVWQDPYLVGERREDTDKTTYGAKLAYSDILGTRAKVSYSLANADVDDDDIGERFDTLERDGWLHEAQIAYAIPVGRGMSFVPGFEFSLGNLEGDANSYKGYEVKLGLRMFSSGYLFNLFAGIGRNDYDNTHPIFGKTREDISYSAFAVVSSSDLLGKKRLFYSLIAGYRHRDSNIGFLDADTFLGGLTLGYKF